MIGKMPNYELSTIMTMPDSIHPWHLNCSNLFHML